LLLRSVCFVYTRTEQTPDVVPVQPVRPVVLVLVHRANIVILSSWAQLP